MNLPAGLEHCQAFIHCQLQSVNRNKAIAGEPNRWRAVTISRQAGTGAAELGEALAQYLHTHGGATARPWMVFDRNLVERVLEEHDLPANLKRFMPEDRISELGDAIEELCGLHPPTWILVRKTMETILHLAELGNVIIIGRGGNVVTASLPGVFHIRLIGSLENRIERLKQSRGLGSNAAMEFIRTEDVARRRYLRKYFRKDIDDPLLYHIVINTDGVRCGAAAQMIGEVLLGKERPK